MLYKHVEKNSERSKGMKRDMGGKGFLVVSPLPLSPAVEQN